MSIPSSQQTLQFYAKNGNWWNQLKPQPQPILNQPQPIMIQSNYLHPQMQTINSLNALPRVGCCQGAK